MITREFVDFQHYDKEYVLHWPIGQVVLDTWCAYVKEESSKINYPFPSRVGVVACCGNGMGTGKFEAVKFGAVPELTLG